MADTNASSNNVATLSILGRIAREMVGSELQCHRVAIGAALELLGIALGIGGPITLKMLIDGLGGGALGSVQIILYIAAFAFSWSGATICSTARIVYSTRIIDQVTGTLAEDALRTALPAAATTRDADSGQTLGLIERLPFSLYIVADGLIWRAVPLVVQVLATAAVMAALVPARYLIALSLILAAYVVTTRIGAKYHREVSKAANEAMGQVSRNNGDILRNARRVVFNGALEREMGGVARRYYDRGRSTQKVTASLVGLSVIQYGTLSLGLFGVLLLAGYDVIRHVLTVGDMVLIQSFTLRLVVPLGGFAFVVSQASTALANLREVLSLTDEVDDAPWPIRFATGAGAVELEDVSFSYGPGLAGLSGITAKIEPGSLTAIVGPNGSGKSTLAQLIAGILQPSAGAVWVDGVSMATIPPRARHQWALYVPQFIGLFNRSLGSNMTYPPTGFSLEELADILKRWHFQEDGRELDFDAMVGEQGERLSGGQMQKLELARVSGVYVPVVILDESTSALDPASEQTVVAELRERFGGNRTFIMITHHESVAEVADNVLFVKDGRLVRQGRHVELLADSAAYRKLWV
jgi:ABC-type multidrug transport system fused ATPase/permease subunit